MFSWAFNPLLFQALLSGTPEEPPLPSSGTGTTTPSFSCTGVTYDQLLGALAALKTDILNVVATNNALSSVRNELLAAIAGINPTGDWAKPADLEALKTELLAAINAPRTLIVGGSAPPPPAAQGYVKIGAVQYDKLSDAAAEIVPGSVVEIYGHLKGLAATAAFLKSCDIVGMTPDAWLEWDLGITERMAFGKGLIVCNGIGNVYTVSNIRLSGARTSDANGAGVRGDQVSSITLQNCNIHDNENGILSLADVHSFIGNTFADNGNAWGTAHHIYVSFFSDIVPSLVTATGNIFLAAKVGNQFKSRAKKTIFSHNLVAELDGSCSWQMDFSNGGEVLVEKNVIEQGPNAQNRNMVSYAPEGLPADGRVNTLAFNDNVVINDHAQNGWMVNIVNQPTTIEAERNIIVGPFAAYLFNGPALATSNAVYLDRAAAGFAAYPFLPEVPVS
jgi:hypothetical protein